MKPDKSWLGVIGVLLILVAVLSFTTAMALHYKRTSEQCQLKLLDNVASKEDISVRCFDGFEYLVLQQGSSVSLAPKFDHYGHPSSCPRASGEEKEDAP